MVVEHHIYKCVILFACACDLHMSSFT